MCWADRIKACALLQKRESMLRAKEQWLPVHKDAVARCGMLLQSAVPIQSSAALVLQDVTQAQLQSIHIAGREGLHVPTLAGFLRSEPCSLSSVPNVMHIPEGRSSFFSALPYPNGPLAV